MYSNNIISGGFSDRRRSRSPRIDRRDRERSRHRSRSRDRKKRRSRDRDVEEIDVGSRRNERRDRGAGSGGGGGAEREKEKKRKRSRSRERERSERKRERRDKDRERDRDRKEKKPDLRDGEIKIKEEPIDGELFFFVTSVQSLLFCNFQIYAKSMTEIFVFRNNLNKWEPFGYFAIEIIFKFY